MSKPQIYARLGVSDILRPKEQLHSETLQIDMEDVVTYLIGYEFEDGTECDEDGEPPKTN